MSLIRNERTKISAGFLNTLAVAIIGAGFIVPFFTMLYSSTPFTPGQLKILALVGPICLIAGCGLHFMARKTLGGLQE